MTMRGRPGSRPAVAPEATTAGRHAHQAERQAAGPEPRPTGVTALLVALVRAYQRWISPMLPPSCRFYPSCSVYAVTALTRFGALRGSLLAVRRVLRCHPFNPGGVDPVPEHRPSRSTVTNRVDRDPTNPGRLRTR